MRTKWKGGFLLDGEEWPEELDKQPGVYRIRSFTTRNNSRKIPRCLGVDDEGVLMIGESTDMWVRLTSFLGAAKGGKHAHVEGQEYFTWKVGKGFPIETLYVDYMKTQTKDDAERLEYQQIKAYRKKFLDTPPLNKSQGKWKEK